MSTGDAQLYEAAISARLSHVCLLLFDDRSPFRRTFSGAYPILPV